MIMNNYVIELNDTQHVVLVHVVALFSMQQANFDFQPVVSCHAYLKYIENTLEKMKEDKNSMKTY